MHEITFAWHGRSHRHLHSTTCTRTRLGCNRCVVQPCMQVNITGSTFLHNTASQWGAAIVVSDQGTVSMPSALHLQPALFRSSNMDTYHYVACNNQQHQGAGTVLRSRLPVLQSQLQLRAACPAEPQTHTAAVTGLEWLFHLLGGTPVHVLTTKARSATDPNCVSASGVARQAGVGT